MRHERRDVDNSPRPCRSTIVVPGIRQRTTNKTTTGVGQITVSQSHFRFDKCTADYLYCLLIISVVK